MLENSGMRDDFRLEVLSDFPAKRSGGGSFFGEDFVSPAFSSFFFIFNVKRSRGRSSWSTMT